MMCTLMILERDICTFPFFFQLILSYGIVCFHPSVLLNNETKFCENNEDKIAVCEKTPSLRSGMFSKFELTVLKSISSRKNIYVPKHAK